MKKEEFEEELRMIPLETNEYKTYSKIYRIYGRKNTYRLILDIDR
jgi:hypothetical protein